jgi:hypothetical protein
MDKHLNIFFSYNQGNLETAERTMQFEDNLTRAVITTLKHLEKDLQKEIILQITKSKTIKSISFEYDLQNTRINISNTKRKHLIILQREESDITKGAFSKFNLSEYKRILSLKNDEKNSLKKEIVQKLKDGKEFESNYLKINYQDLLSCYQLILGNRPDGWIHGDKDVIMFETKIGYNKASVYQIYRHLTGENGFRITSHEIKKGEDSDFYNLISLTWSELVQIFKKVATKSERDRFLINELLSYITMTGQILDFSYITSNNEIDEIDDEIHKDQFGLFLNDFDKILMKRKINLFRGKRPFSGLWESYGLKNVENDPSKNPHYTIGFWKKEIVVYLTTNKTNQVIRNLGLIQKFYDNKKNELALDKFTLSRYFISQIKYKLVDPKKGQIKGEINEPFKFYIKFPEIGENMNTVTEILRKFSELNMYKQFELGFSIQFFHFAKIRDNDDLQIRKLNKELLEKPSNVLESFADFIEETLFIFNSMNGTKKFHIV